MAHANKFLKRQREHHPQVSIGLFFILLGVVLLVATNDMLKLGGFSEYFTWQTVLVFIGILLFLNLKFVGGIILISVGLWFWLDDRYGHIPELIRTIYWPAIIILIGLTFIISSFIKRRKTENKTNE